MAWGFCLGGWQAKLPGESRLVQVLACGSDALWVIREAGVADAAPWLVSAKRAQALVLPDPTRFIGLHPNQPLGLAVTPHGMIRMDERTGTRKADARQISLDQVHPWLVAQSLNLPNWQGFTFFADNHWWLVPWSEDLPIRQIAAKLTPPNFPKRDYDLAWWQPRVLASTNSLVWMDAEHLIRLNLDEGVKPAQVTVPTTGPMERIAALPDRDSDRVDWLVYGGQRGQLDTFGWHIRTASNPREVAGEGIFVGYGYDATSQPRLWIWTVSRSFSSQLWQRLRGTVKYSVTVLVRSPDGWRILAEETLRLDEADDDRHSELLWGPDVNEDGLGDLIAIDPGSGLRAYVADRKRGFEDQSIRLGEPANRLFALSQRLVRAIEGQDSWMVEVLP